MALLPVGTLSLELVREGVKSALLDAAEAAEMLLHLVGLGVAHAGVVLPGIWTLAVDGVSVASRNVSSTPLTISCTTRPRGCVLFLGKSLPSRFSGA
jgi:hypothetical protein